MTQLGDYLNRIAARRREPGVHDCCTLPADWIVSLGLPDPMASFRGAYADERGADDLVFEAGGLVALFDQVAGSLIPRVELENVAAGDVAVAQIFGTEAGTIYTGDRWVFVLDRGLGFQRLESSQILAIWGVSRWVS